MIFYIVKLLRSLYKKSLILRPLKCRFKRESLISSVICASRKKINIQENGISTWLCWGRTGRIVHDFLIWMAGILTDFGLFRLRRLRSCARWSCWGCATPSVKVKFKHAHSDEKYLHSPRAKTSGA